MAFGQRAVKSSIYIEVYSPPQPNVGSVIRYYKGYRGRTLEQVREQLHPTMTCLFRIEHVASISEALCLIMESLAGLPRPNVSLVFGPNKK